MYKFHILLALLLLASCSSPSSHNTTPAKKLAAIPVELTTHLGDKQQFIRGDEIQFLLSLGSDAYIYMYYVDAEKNITQILPSENQRSNHYSSGYFLTVPEYEDGYRFIISKPFGEEKIWIMASDQSIDIDASGKSIETIKQKIKMNSKREYGEYVLNIVTMP